MKAAISGAATVLLPHVKDYLSLLEVVFVSNLELNCENILLSITEQCETENTSLKTKYES